MDNGTALTHAEGNVRVLRGGRGADLLPVDCRPRHPDNTVHRAVLMAKGNEIGPEAILTLAAEQVTKALIGRTVADVERELILETLKHCLGNRTRAANILGISIRTLRNKLNEYAESGTPIPSPAAREYVCMPVAT